MKLSHIYLMLFFALMVFSGCSPKLNPYSIYRPLEVDNVYKLQADSVTRTEVEAMFGQPLRRAINERGDLYTYAYFGDSLFIQFTRDQFVSRFNFQPEAFSPDYENQDVKPQRFRERVLRRIIPGTTAIHELDAMFGRPSRRETGITRIRTTFAGREEDLVVYSQVTNGLVINYELKPR